MSVAQFVGQGGAVQFNRHATPRTDSAGRVVVPSGLAAVVAPELHPHLGSHAVEVRGCYWGLSSHRLAPPGCDPCLGPVSHRGVGHLVVAALGKVVYRRVGVVCEVYGVGVAYGGKQGAGLGVTAAHDLVENLLIGGLLEGVGDGYPFGLPWFDVAGFDQADHGGVVVCARQGDNQFVVEFSLCELPADGGLCVTGFVRSRPH